MVSDSARPRGQNGLGSVLRTSVYGLFNGDRLQIRRAVNQYRADLRKAQWESESFTYTAVRGVHARASGAPMCTRFWRYARETGGRGPANSARRYSVRGSCDYFFDSLLLFVIINNNCIDVVKFGARRFGDIFLLRAPANKYLF